MFKPLLTTSLSFHKGFLELVNNMLTSGMVPALFPDDEKDAIISQVRRILLIHADCDAEIDANQSNVNLVISDQTKIKINSYSSNIRTSQKRNFQESLGIV